MQVRTVFVLVLGLTSALALPSGLLCADEAKAAPMAEPMLYVAVGAEQTLFLVGTLHVADRRVTAVPGLVRIAVDRTDELYGEVAFDEDIGTQMLAYVRLPRNRSLKQILGPDLWQRTESLMALRGQSLDDWDRIKPWIVDTHVGELFAPEATRDDTTLDETIYELAKSKGKPVAGLETVYEQVRVFEVLPYEEQVALFEETVERLERDRREGVNSVETMIQAYLSGEPETLRAEVDTYFDFDLPRDQELYDRLHRERNLRMLDRIEEKAKDARGKTRMMVVGAAHLAGRQGMLSMLRQRDYTVWRARKADDLPASREQALAKALVESRRENDALSRAVDTLSTRVSDLEAEVANRSRSVRCCPKRRRVCRPKTCERKQR